jgi:hypothetical protein
MAAAPHAVVQNRPLNCGAACLLCAARELRSSPLGSLQLPDGSKLSVLVAQGRDFAGSNEPWMDAIYEISGAGKNGYSLPSGIVRAAELLGMTATVLKDTTTTVQALQLLFPGEQGAAWATPSSSIT